MNDPFERIAEHHNEVMRLRKAANELVENHIPQIWKDGDVRYLNSMTYNQLKGYMDRVRELNGGPRAGERGLSQQLVYRGIFGELIIKEAK